MPASCHVHVDDYALFWEVSSYHYGAEVSLLKIDVKRRNLKSKVSATETELQLPNLAQLLTAAEISINSPLVRWAEMEVSPSS